MKLVREAGGVKTTIMDDRMQRAPAFLFDSAREAREFGAWLHEHFDDVKEAAEQTTRSGKLQDIEQYTASRILFCRFNYTTGDAAGQNLTGKATAVACEWIRAHYPKLEHYFLESNLAGFMSGANNNGAHSANGITAIFIATGQDVANVAESSAAYNYGELLPDGNLYFSVTIPSLIVATYGGGTGLATQRECLELMGCYG